MGSRSSNERYGTVWAWEHTYLFLNHHFFLLRLHKYGLHVRNVACMRNIIFHVLNDCGDSTSTLGNHTLFGFHSCCSAKNRHYEPTLSINRQWHVCLFVFVCVCVLAHVHRLRWNVTSPHITITYTNKSLGEPTTTTECVIFFFASIASRLVAIHFPTLFHIHFLSTYISLN